MNRSCLAGAPISTPIPPRVPKWPHVKLMNAPIGECWALKLTEDRGFMIAVSRPRRAAPDPRRWQVRGSQTELGPKEILLRTNQNATATPAAEPSNRARPDLRAPESRSPFGRALTPAASAADPHRSCPSPYPIRPPRPA